MGNCVQRGFGGGDEVEEMVKVVTLNGGIMELYAPITAGSITSEFPDHGIFLRQRLPEEDQLSSHPLLDTQSLHPGRLYYLLPLSNTSAVPPATDSRLCSSGEGGIITDNKMKVKPKRQEHPETALPRYKGGSTGVWKVRLVIKPEQLSEILSHESRTEALIESVRTAAKCGATATGNIDTTTDAGNRTSKSSWVSSMAANDCYSNRCSVSSNWRIEH